MRQWDADAVAALKAEVGELKNDGLELAKKFRDGITAREQPGADTNAWYGRIMGFAQDWEAAGLRPNAAACRRKSTPTAPVSSMD